MCPSGGTAINYTPIPPFVTQVLINPGSITAYAGCYDFATGGPNIPGSIYKCEDLPFFGPADFDCGSGNFGDFGADTGNLYCTTGALPAGQLTCTPPPGS